MQPKLFLMLAVLVLLAALLGGNPFLSKGPGAYPAVPLNAAPPPSPASEGALPVGFGSTRSGVIDWNEGRNPVVDAINHGRAVPAGLVLETPPDLTGQPRAGQAKGTGQAKGMALALLCPDPLLRPLVIDVETHASGATIWVLRDGRRLWRNPIAGKEPLLVPVPTASRKPKGQ